MGSAVPKWFRLGAKNLACRADLLARVNGVPVSNFEGIMVDMIKFRNAIEKELSKVTQRETRSVLSVTNTTGHNILKN